LLQAIREKKALTDEIKDDLEQALKDFKDRWTEQTAVAARTASTVASTQATGAQTTAAGA
jgi:hypothetical protein